MPAKKTTTPKAPQDRKPKQADIPARDVTETPGWELMKPIDEVPVWDQTDLLALMQELYADSEKGNARRLAELNEERVEAGKEPFEELPSYEEQDFDIRMLGQLIKSITPFAKDAAEFTKFVSGSGAIERGSELAMAWVGQMGESLSSDAS